MGKAYNIGTINEELLTRIACELDTRDIKTGLEQVCVPASLYRMHFTNPLPLIHACLTHHWRNIFPPCCCYPFGLAAAVSATM